jgi:hypothetical protein
MTKLEIMKLKAELMRVQAAKAEMLYIIAQREDEIDRLQDNVKKQEDTESLIKSKLEQ